MLVFRDRYMSTCKIHKSIGESFALEKIEGSLNDSHFTPFFIGISDSTKSPTLELDSITDGFISTFPVSTLCMKELS